MDHPIVDRNAAVYAQATALIQAPKEHVWHVLTDFRNWPAWNPAFRWARLDGALREGAQVTWITNRGAPVQMRLAALRSHEQLGWVCDTAALNAGYLLTLAPGPENVLARVEASVESGLARLMPSFSERALRATLSRGLAALRAEVETVRKAASG